MTENYFFYAFVSLTVAAILRYLSKATGKSIKANEHGETLLKMHKLYNIIGYIAMALCLIVTIGPIITSEPDIAMYLMIVFMFLIFGGLGLLSILYYRNHYLCFNNLKIEVRNVFGRTKTIYWENIQKASFNSISGLLTLKDNAGEKVKIHQHLVGLGKFVAFLEHKTKWSSKELKLPIRRNNTA